ncbi:BON domain-containing protein [bacterium]|nr:BON domain-containing protein [bacterium]
MRQLQVCSLLVLVLFVVSMSGCLLAAGAGAEAGYILAQDDRSTKETVKDQYLVSAIKTKLLANSKTPGMDINVDSYKGKITLRGALMSQDEVDQALSIARNTDGVTEVESKLVVVQ